MGKADLFVPEKTISVRPPVGDRIYHLFQGSSIKRSLTAIMKYSCYSAHSFFYETDGYKYFLIP